MRPYEMMVILDPELGEEGIQAQKETLEAWIREGGDEITEVDEWGRRKFAYPIKKRQEGYYLVYYFNAEPAMTLTLRKRLELNKGVLRHMILRRDE